MPILQKGQTAVRFPCDFSRTPDGQSAVRLGRIRRRLLRPMNDMNEYWEFREPNSKRFSTLIFLHIIGLRHIDISSYQWGRTAPLCHCVARLSVRTDLYQNLLFEIKQKSNFHEKRGEPWRGPHAILPAKRVMRTSAYQCV